MYQARLSVFERVALADGGVDALLRAELLRALAMVTYLDARPAEDVLEVRVFAVYLVEVVYGSTPLILVGYVFALIETSRYCNHQWCFSFYIIVMICVQGLLADDMHSAPIERYRQLVLPVLRVRLRVQHCIHWNQIMIAFLSGGHDDDMEIWQPQGSCGAASGGVY